MSYTAEPSLHSNYTWLSHHEKFIGLLRPSRLQLKSSKTHILQIPKVFLTYGSAIWQTQRSYTAQLSLNFKPEWLSHLQTPKGLIWLSHLQIQRCNAAPPAFHMRCVDTRDSCAYEAMAKKKRRSEAANRPRQPADLLHVICSLFLVWSFYRNLAQSHIWGMLFFQISLPLSYSSYGSAKVLKDSSSAGAIARLQIWKCF